MKTTIVKTRKPHECGACQKITPTGSLMQCTLMYHADMKSWGMIDPPDNPTRFYYCGCTMLDNKGQLPQWWKQGWQPEHQLRGNQWN